MKTFPPAIADALHRQGIGSFHDLRRELGTSDLATGLPALAKQAGIDAGDLLDALATEETERTLDTGTVRGAIGALRRHVPDFAALAAVVGVVAMVWFAVNRSPHPAEVVVAKEALPAGWILRADDLERAELRGGRGLVDPEEAIGRVALEPLVAQQAIRDGALGPRVPEGASVISLPLAPGSPDLHPRETVTLLVADPEGAVAATIRDALVLRASDGTATVAVAPQALARVAHLLARTHVLPVRGAVPAPAGAADDAPEREIAE